MTDIITGWDPATGTGDWIFVPIQPGLWVDQNGAPVTDDQGLLVDAVIDDSTTKDFINDLSTSVLISLFSDAAAGASDVIPDGTANRRGWWGGDVGSKIWLLSRSKALPSVAPQVTEYAQDALAWLVTDGVASDVAVTSTWLSTSALQLTIVITRDGSTISLKFQNLWDFA